MRVNSRKCSRNSADCKYVCSCHDSTAILLWEPGQVTFALNPIFSMYNQMVRWTQWFSNLFSQNHMWNRPTEELNQNLWRVKSWHLYFIKSLLLSLWYSQGWWPRWSLRFFLRLSKILYLKRIRVWPFRPPLPCRLSGASTVQKASLNANNWRRDTISSSHSHVVSSICSVENNYEVAAQQFDGKHIISRKLRSKW